MEWENTGANKNIGQIWPPLATFQDKFLSGSREYQYWQDRRGERLPFFNGLTDLFYLFGFFHHFYSTLRGNKTIGQIWPL